MQGLILSDSWSALAVDSLQEGKHRIYSFPGVSSVQEPGEEAFYDVMQSLFCPFARTGYLQ